MEDDDDTPEVREWGKRLAAKAMRMLAVIRGDIPLPEMTQEDVDLIFRRLAPPNERDDFDESLLEE